MNKKLILLLLVLTGCFSRTTMMTREKYDEVSVGMSINEVTDMVGKPYAIYKKGHNSEEYEYIERIQMGDDYFISNHYYLLVSNDQVVGKRVKIEKSPPYELIYEEDPNQLP